MSFDIGFCTWNRWGDDVVDRPDNTDEILVSSLVNGFLARGRSVHLMQRLDDINPTFRFEFAGERKKAFNALTAYDTDPFDIDYDAIFCRWRWKLSDKPDKRLDLQKRMLDKYLDTRTQIFVMDEDFQLDHDERNKLLSHRNVRLIEASEAAYQGRRYGTSYVPHPFPFGEGIIAASNAKVLPQYGLGQGDHLEWGMRLGYVGNNYEREELVGPLLGDEPVEYPMMTHFFGNWLKYDATVMNRLPGIAFHTKVGRHMRDWVYQHSIAVPMLAKRVYFNLGHITPRLHEVLCAGGIPIGFSRFLGAERYYLPELIVNEETHMPDMIDWIEGMSHADRRALHRRECEHVLKNRIFDTDLCLHNMGY